MSRIYFHTPERTVEVYGTERAYMNVLSGSMALAVIRLDKHRDREWAQAVTAHPTHVFERGEWWATDWETAFRVGFSEMRLRVKGGEIEAGDLTLNTLIATGSPTLSLLAKLHGTCEDYAWVDPEDTGWFADLIEQGRSENVLRPECGWEAVAELAREVESGLAGPIVTSYSVCESFPNSGVADYEPPVCTACGGSGEPNPRMVHTDVEYDDHCTTCGGEGKIHDAWYDLPDAQRWDLGERGMKARPYNRQISPETLSVGFMSGASAFDLMAEKSRVIVGA